MSFKSNSTIIIDSWSGRLGNNLIQLSNAIFTAERFNCKLDYPFHKLIHKREIDFSDQDPKNFYISRFYDKKDCKGMYPNLVERRRIFQKYILGLLKLDLTEKEPAKEKELVIQMRSGDMFNTKPPPLYLPSPVSFFIKIIEDFQYQKVCIVSEDKRNPCIDALISAFPFISWQSSDLESDMTKLVNAENLCITIGTFGLINVLLSSRLQNLYIDNLPKGILNFGFFEDASQQLPFKIHRYKIDKYIPHRTWANNYNQLSMVLNHPAQLISYIG